MVRNANGQFAKGESGNPSGRPKRSEIEQQTIAEICSLAPQAVKSLKKLLKSADTPPNVRMKAIELVVERVCGKVQSAIIEEDTSTMEKLDTLLSEVMREAYESVGVPTSELEIRQ